MPFKHLPTMRVGFNHSRFKNYNPGAGAHQLSRDKVIALFFDTKKDYVEDLDLHIGTKQCKKIKARQYVTLRAPAEIEELYKRYCPEVYDDPAVKNFLVIKVNHFETRFFVKFPEDAEWRNIGNHYPREFSRAQRMDQFLAELGCGEGAVFGCDKYGTLIFGMGFDVFTNKDYGMGLQENCMSSIVEQFAANHKVH